MPLHGNRWSRAAIRVSRLRVGEETATVQSRCRCSVVTGVRLPTLEGGKGEATAEELGS